MLIYSHFSFWNVKLWINKLLLLLQTEPARKNSELRNDKEYNKRKYWSFCFLKGNTNYISIFLFLKRKTCNFIILSNNSWRKSSLDYLIACILISQDLWCLSISVWGWRYAAFNKYSSNYCPFSYLDVHQIQFLIRIFWKIET